ncbi:hypothetical protein A2U01_0077247, partial [Trifolium medium]|nr:hypothetical protein [Trifolium medium]
MNYETTSYFAEKSSLAKRNPIQHRKRKETPQLLPELNRPPARKTGTGGAVVRGRV